MQNKIYEHEAFGVSVLLSGPKGTEVNDIFLEYGGKLVGRYIFHGTQAQRIQSQSSAST